MSRWIRRFAVVAALVLLAALGARVVIGHSSRARLDNARDAFDSAYGARVLADLAPPPVALADNIAPVLLDMASELGLEDPRWRKLAGRVAAFQTLAPEQWSEQQRLTADEFAVACGPMERYEELAALEQSNFELDYSIGWSVPLPPYLDVLLIAKCALTQGRLGLTAGDRHRFLTAYRALVNVSRGLRNEPLLIGQLMSIAVQRHHHYLLHQALGSGALDLVTIEALLAIDEGRSMREGVATGLQAEALLVAATPSQVVLVGLSDEAPLLHSASVEKAIAFLMEPTGDLIRAATIENRMREIESLDRHLVELVRELDEGTFYDDSSRRLDKLAPSIDDVLLKAYAADTTTALARSALAVARDLAAGLTEVSSPLLDDPISGAPIVWKATEGRLTGSAPEAAALWAERAVPGGSLPPIFEWSVAIPSSG